MLSVESDSLPSSKRVCFGISSEYYSIRVLKFQQRCIADKLRPRERRWVIFFVAMCLLSQTEHSASSGLHFLSLSFSFLALYSAHNKPLLSDSRVYKCSFENSHSVQCKALLLPSSYFFTYSWPTFYRLVIQLCHSQYRTKGSIPASKSRYNYRACCGRFQITNIPNET